MEFTELQNRSASLPDGWPRKLCNGNTKAAKALTKATLHWRERQRATRAARDFTDVPLHFARFLLGACAFQGSTMR